MKYLVTWHNRGSVYDLYTSRFFDNRERALRMYNDFKKNLMFDDVKIIAIKEKTTKKLIIDVKVVKWNQKA